MNAYSDQHTGENLYAIRRPDGREITMVLSDSEENAVKAWRALSKTSFDVYAELVEP